MTSTNSLEKVKHTLEQVEKLPPEDQVERLYILTITKDAPTEAMKKRTLGSCFSGEKHIWNIPELLRQMMDLEVSTLEDIHAYLEVELGTLHQKMEQPHLVLRPVSAIGSGFVGREAELAEIRRRIDVGEKLIVLSGLGGMGKTELAVRFGQDHDGAAYFTRFNDSFTHTLAEMAYSIRPKLSKEEAELPEEARCEMVLNILEECGGKDILIIDNVDADEGTLSDLMRDPACKALRKMELQLILTTRFDRDRAMGVVPMPNGTLYEIFENHGVSLEASKMDELIDAVNGHTLTIDLMARTLNAKGWRKVTADMLLEDLRSNNLPSAQYRKIATDYNQSEDQAQIYQHLSVVFDAKSIPEDAQAILRWATLLPADGMNGEYFANTMNDEGQAMLDTLIDHGWLNAEDGVITIHPVIRLVCREELTPSDENCGAFLKTLWGQLSNREYDRVKFAQMAEVFAAAMEIDGRPETRAEWLNYSGRLLNDLMESRKATALYEQYIPELEQKIPTHHTLATAYNNVGMTYGDLGEHSKALEYKLKDLAICEKVLPPEHPHLAISYGNVGTTYGDLGDHNKALEYKLKALAIREKILPPEHPDLATSYNNVGVTYSNLGEHSKALEYLLKALAIREKILPPEHPDLAQSYNNVGSTYGDLGEHSKALEYQLKALAICEKVLPPEHPHLATSYNNVGTTYGDLGDHHKALEYKLKALAIREKVLPPEHPDLASSYNNVGFTYGDLGEHSKALEYQLKALAICEKVLPPEHPHLATSYNNVGVTYFYLKQYATAMKYLEKALVIYEKSLPAGHPHTESTRRSIEALRTWM